MPTTAECNRILAAIEQLGGAATTLEIAAYLKEKTDRISKNIHTMRKFQMLRIKQAFNHGKKHGFVYELVK